MRGTESTVEHDHDVPHAGAEQRRHEQRKDERRDAEQRIDHRLEDRIDPLAHVAGHHAQAAADDERRDGRDRTDVEGDAGAVDDPTEQVTSELVGPEEVSALARSGEEAPTVLSNLPVRGDQWGEQGDQQEHHDDEQRCDTERLRLEEAADLVEASLSPFRGGVVLGRLAVRERRVDVDTHGSTGGEGIRGCHAAPPEDLTRIRGLTHP